VLAGLVADHRLVASTIYSRTAETILMYSSLDNYDRRVMHFVTTIRNNVEKASAEDFESGGGMQLEGRFPRSSAF